MPDPYLVENIQGLKTNTGSNKSAHTVHNVSYKLDETKEIPIFYKENKHNTPQASTNEVVFSELARLFMLPHTTPPQHLVKNGKTGLVTGVASENIQLSIAAKEKGTSEYLNVVIERGSNYQFKTEPKDSKKIPFKFLNELPQGFFAHLMELRKHKKLNIDMDSLASSLVGKYTLEEDDLHKGNIGIYVIKKGGKPYVTFFNIDHDLMFSGSLTSFMDARFSNLGYRGSAFNITERDLLSFPDLQDSKNHYWPTRKRFMVKYGDDKVYADPNERTAFRELQRDPDFNRYKWKRLLKNILIPNELMQTAMGLHLDKNIPKEAAHLNLITQAMVDRVIKLRAVLFSIPQFRSYLFSPPGHDDLANIKTELEVYITGIPTLNKEAQTTLLRGISDNAVRYFTFCNPDADHRVRGGDTPLHIAIRLGDYRFEQSENAFGHFLSTANDFGQKPIDVAADLAKNYEPGSEKIDPGKDPIFIIKSLIAHGAEMTAEVADILRSKGIKNLHDYHFQSKYYGLDVDNYDMLKALITQIGMDNNLSLKSKKIITTQVIKDHIGCLKQDELEKFKHELNGTSDTPIAPEFLFISQLRSSLWFVRLIRGLYGHSSTRMELNSLINLSEKNMQKGNPFHFFSSSPKTASSEPPPSSLNKYPGKE